VNPFNPLLDGATLALVVGVFLLIYNILLGGVEFIVRAWRKTFLSWAGRRLRQMGIITEKPYQAHSELDGKRLALLLAIPLLALAVRDWMLSPLVVLVGCLVLLWANFQAKQTGRVRVNEDAEMAALQLRALMRVDRSLLNALNKVELPVGVMRQAIEQVSSRLRMHQPPDQAAQALKGMPGTVTARLAALIAHSASLTDELQDALLLTLEQEAHRQKLKRSKLRQTLSLVKGTIRLLQVVVAGAISFVLLTPAWRDFFLQDIPHRTLLAVLVAGVTLASLYFEVEVYQLDRGEAF